MIVSSGAVSSVVRTRLVWTVGFALAVGGASSACGKSSKDSPEDGAGAGSGAVSGMGGSGGASAGASTGGRGGAAGSQAGGGNSAGGRGGGGAGGQSEGGAGAQAGGGAGGGSADGPLEPLMDAFCATARTCCTAAGMPLGPLDACEAAFSSQVDTIAAIEKGTVEIDAGALAACVAAYDDARTTCVLTQVFALCRGIFVGTVADGDPCTDVMECERDRGPKTCLKLQNAEDPNVGVCTTPPRGTSGTPCVSSCPTGAECSTTASSPDDTYPIALCYEEDGLFCPIGESCAPIVDDGAECVWNEACGSDGFCVSTCATRSGLGETCLFDYECEVGLTCDVDQCAGEPVATNEICAGRPPSFN